MTIANATATTLSALKGKLTAALKAVEQKLLTMNPAIDAEVTAACVAANLLSEAQVGAGVSTTALVPSTVAITCTITGGGATATIATPTVVAGVVTAIALS